MLVYSKATNKLNSNDSYWFNQSITNIQEPQQSDPISQYIGIPNTL